MITSVEKIYPTPLSVLIRLGFLLSFSIFEKISNLELF